ncbi:asparagine synthase-related protein [Pseudoroseomonas wenyumeiae]
MRAMLQGHDPGERFATLMADCDPDASLLQAQYADLHTYLPGDILTKVDRTSMAVSLEVRPPLLDHTLVEWGMALPDALKLQRGQGKQVLRQAVAPLLPDSILNGPKQGFAAAIGGQFREGADTVRARLLGAPMLDLVFSTPPPSRRWWTATLPAGTTTARRCGSCWCWKASWPAWPAPGRSPPSPRPETCPYLTKPRATCSGARCVAPAGSWPGGW